MEAESCTIECAQMEICHDHNLAREVNKEALRYGIRLSLPANDPFASVLSEDWEKYHWYTSTKERDAALVEMSRQHQYSRQGDMPTFIYQKIER